MSDGGDRRGLLERVRDGLRDHVVEVVAGAVWAGCGAVALWTANNFWYLFEMDRDAAVGLALSFAFLGFALGWLASWARGRLLPLGRTRRAISRLPRNQMAAAWRAYQAQGAFYDREVRDDLKALAGMGVVARVGSGPYESWSLSPLARRAIDGSERLSARLELADRELSDEVAAKEREREVEAAQRVVDSLSFDELSSLVQIMDEGPTEADADLEEYLVRDYGHVVFDIEPAGPDEILVSVTEQAREALRRRPEALARVRTWNERCAEDPASGEAAERGADQEGVSA